MDPLASLDTTEDSPRALAVGTVVAGRYRVERLLGTGGMGAVYRAEHVHMRKTVALKILHKEFAGISEVVQRFEREAIAAARIEHPNVAGASDFGVLDGGSCYLVLEFVDGQSLRARIDEGPLPTTLAVDVARQTALALSAAHAAGIIHRDLKPDNVMLVPQPDGTVHLKVLDFGIARVTLPDAHREGSNLTRVGVIMGTVAYMSPEQAVGHGVDERTDLYALGVMLHEMIAGRPPFEGELPAQVLARQLTETPPPLPGGTPEALAALVADLLQKSPADRPASAREVLERLGSLTSSPLASPPRKRWRRLLLGIGLGTIALGASAFVALRTAALGSTGVRAESVVPPASGESLDARPADAPSASAPAPSGSVDQPASVAAPSATALPSASSAPASQSAGPKRAGKATGKRQPQETSKRRTGPGGIYIPPPRDWFK
jgi:eukaryotic-like serine/threonine-protein kinase